MSGRYTASKSRSSGRTGWSISFRHPLRTDASGRAGLKVRRGLGTADQAEADRLVAQMNELLRDERYWAITARALAEARFAPVIVEAFFSGLEVPMSTPLEMREDSIPLPTKEEGYARVLLVGTTGAGKTTLLRHLIGSDPRLDRFPSTATGRTTTADIEVITAKGPYMGVVTFLSERAVRSNIQECLAEALIAARKGAEPAEIAKRLLQHPNQTFRLNYTLGDLAGTEEGEDGGWGFEKAVEPSDDIEEEGAPTETERRRNQRALEMFVQRSVELARGAGEDLTKALGVEWAALKGADLDAVEAMLIEEAESRPAHTELVEDIMSAVACRFEYVPAEELTRSSTGWPLKWEYTSADRADFIGRIRWFSSNYAPRFGRLLTPLVQGIRVRGPLFPRLTPARETRLVLIDGQGLGHTAESSGSVTTHITSRFDGVDAILLVDSAQQPMQAAPLAALRALAVSGHQGKALVAFTHFDQVKGPNLPNARAKREHVLASVRTALAKLRSEVGESAVRSIEQNLEDRCFTFGWMDEPTEKLASDAPKVIQELVALIAAVERSIAPAVPVPVSPVYDPASLLFAVQAATRDFRARWNAKLGLGSLDGERKEHWARIKALNRRIADRSDIEYDTLRPVADLYSRIAEEISKFLEKPIAWEGQDAENEDERARAIDGVRRTVSAAVHTLSLHRLIEEHVQEWVTAYGYSGRGSTFVRAQEIRDIYEEAAPVPEVTMEPRMKDYLDAVRRVVHEAVAAGGGKMLYSDTTPARVEAQSG